MSDSLTISKLFVREAMGKANFDDPSETRTFLETLRLTCASPENILSITTLSELETVKLFFKNQILRPLGMESPVFYTFTFNNRNFATSKHYKLVEYALTAVGKTWDTAPNESGRRVLLDVLITGCLKEVQISRSQNLTAFRGIPLSCTVSEPETNRIFTVTGCCDLAIGYSFSEHGKHEKIDIFLVIIEDNDGNTRGNSFTQLIAYMGMVQKARKSERKCPTAIYGICSDGIQYTFGMVDTELGVYRSASYSILLGLSGVYSFVVHMLESVQRSILKGKEPT